MDNADPAGGGLLSSLRRAGTVAMSLFRTRIELFAVELQEEKLHALNLLAWLAAAVAFGVAGLLLGLGALAFFLWQRFGYSAVFVLALASVLCSTAFFWKIRFRILSSPGPFATTISELGKDIDRLRSHE